MGVRRQVYLDEKTDRVLAEESHRTGVSVSELVRRAVDQAYGRRRLTWEEVFAHPLKANNARQEPWVYDRLFDGAYADEIDRELDQGERRELDRHASPGL